MVWQAASPTWHAGGEPAERARATVRAQLRDPDAVAVLVRRDGEPAGVGVSIPHVDEHGSPILGWRHVALVHVYPEHHRRGVGRAVVERLLAAHPAAGASLWAETGNAAAEALYAATGFTATTDRSSLPGGSPIRRWERAPEDDAGEPGGSRG